MEVFNYSPDTGAYSGSAISYADPLDPTRVVVPAQATDVRPPSYDPLTEHPFYNVGEGWVVLPLLRGKTYYDAGGTPQVVATHIRELPEGTTLVPPPSYRHYLDPHTLEWVEAQVTEAEAKHTRSKLLAESDWTQMPDSPLSDGAKAAWADYRQALRDITDQAGYPTNIEWPEAP